MKDLTFVLCSRNDGYARNSLWRLQTSLDFLAHLERVLSLVARCDPPLPREGATGRGSMQRSAPSSFTGSSGTATAATTNRWGLADEELALRPARAVDATAVRPTEHPPGQIRELTAIAAEIAWQTGLAAARTVRGALLGDRID